MTPRMLLHWGFEGSGHKQRASGLGGYTPLMPPPQSGQLRWSPMEACCTAKVLMRLWTEGETWGTSRIIWKLSVAGLVLEEPFIQGNSLAANLPSQASLFLCLQAFQFNRLLPRLLGAGWGRQSLSCSLLCTPLSWKGGIHSLTSPMSHHCGQALRWLSTAFMLPVHVPLQPPLHWLPGSFPDCTTSWGGALANAPLASLYAWALPVSFVRSLLCHFLHALLKSVPMASIPAPLTCNCTLYFSYNNF